MCLQYKSFENTVGKGEIAHNEQFLLFPLCFLPFIYLCGELFIKIKMVAFKLFQFGRVLNVMFGKMSNILPHNPYYLENIVGMCIFSLLFS